MTIKKILNNNVVIAINSRNQECVATGKGIAFEKKAGDVINISRVEKIFSLQEKGVAEKLSRIVENIPLDHLRVCDEIINMAQQELSGRLSEKIYLTLIDHVAFAIDRYKDGINLTSSLKWEMKQFYRDEYRVGLMALEIIEKRLDVHLIDDEAAFIAFHLVNAGSVVNINVEESLCFISGVLEIVQRHFEIEFDEESLPYIRFLTHLKYFSQRIFSKSGTSTREKDIGLLHRLQFEMAKENACADEIAVYIQSNYKYTVGIDEKVYLLIHIHSMLFR